MEGYQTVKEKATKGVLWNIFGVYGNMATGGLIAILLARILGPDVYGTLFSVMVFIGFVPILVNLGFEQALISIKDVTEKEIESVFTFILVTASFYTVVLLCVLPYLIGRYTTVDEVNIVYCLVLLVIFNALGLVPKAILGRSLGFDGLNKAMVFATPIPGLIAVAMAFLEFGIWALVVQQLLVSIFRTSLYFYFAKWKPKLNFNFAQLKRFKKFCTNLFADQSLFYLARNMDGAIIAAMFPSAIVGLYTRAMETLRKPVAQVNTIFLSVLFPSLSKLQGNQQQLNEVCDKLLQVISFVIFPVVAGIGLLSEEIVYYLFGEEWLEMVPFMEVFALGIVIIPITYVGTNAILAMGDTRSLLLSNVIYRLALIAGLGILAFLKTPAIYYAVAVSIGFFFHYGITMFFWKRIGNRTSLMNIELLWRPLVNTLLALVVAYLVQLQLNDAPVWQSFTLTGGVFAVVYGLSALLTNVKPLQILANNLPDKVRNRLPGFLTKKIY